MKKEVEAALKKITSYNEKYNLTGENTLTTCVNKFDKTLYDGVIIDDCGITMYCPCFGSGNICMYEKCSSYQHYLEYLASKPAARVQVRSICE